MASRPPGARICRTWARVRRGPRGAENVEQGNHVELPRAGRRKILFNHAAVDFDSLLGAREIRAAFRRLDPEGGKPGLLHAAQKISRAAADVQNRSRPLAPKNCPAHPAIKVLLAAAPLLAIIVASVKFAQFLRWSAGD